MIMAGSTTVFDVLCRMTDQAFDEHPELVEVWRSDAPLNRLARPDELRGVVTWLASDASSYSLGPIMRVTTRYILITWLLLAKYE